MKWLSGESHSTGIDTIDMLNQSSNGHENIVTPQLLRQNQSQDFQLSMGPSQDLTNQTLRSSGQDEQVSMVGYMFPRDASDYMQATQHFINLKQQQRWALGDDTVTAELADQQSPVQSQQGLSPQSVQVSTPQQHLAAQQTQQQQIASSTGMGGVTQPLMFTQPIHPQLPPHLQAIQFTQYRTNGQPPITQIAPSAKKLWGVEEPKEDSHKTSGGILNLNDHQMWRDSTWSTSDHGVTQGMTMVAGGGARRGPGGATFPGPDSTGAGGGGGGPTAGGVSGGGGGGNNILSPRSSDSSNGLGMKMVDFVLGTSPTGKDSLEPRMRGLVLSSDGSDGKKDKDKAPNSPYDVKKELGELPSGPIQTNGLVPVVQNGIDTEDKYKYASAGPGGVVCYSRTPGSRQPSPTDDGSELAAVQAAQHQVHLQHKAQQQQQHGQQALPHDVVIVQNHHHSLLNHQVIPHLHPAPPPHPQHPMSHVDSVNQHFDHMMSMEAAAAAAQAAQQFEPSYSAQGVPGVQQGGQQQGVGGAPQHQAGPGMDSPNVLQPAFDVQVRTQNFLSNLISCSTWDIL